MVVKYCKKCDTQYMVAGTDFCPKCGNPLETIQEQLTESKKTTYLLKEEC